MLTGWSGKYKYATITGSVDGALSDYQIKEISVAYVSSMNTDFSDIRFTDTSDTLYDHWLKEKTDSTSAVFYVKIPTIPVSPGTTILWVQYGNSSAVSAASGDDTFIFFDDFPDSTIDTTKWNTKIDTDASIDQSSINYLFTGDGAQGLAADGDYIYSARNTGVGTNSEIYVYEYDGTEITASPFDGPPHGSGGCIRADNDTLLFGSGGSEDPVLWEINKSTGALIRGWDFTGDTDFLDGAGLVAYKSADTVYIHASNSTSFRILEVTLNEDESAEGEVDATYTVVDYWTDTKLGAAQGLDSDGSNLRYAYDKSTTEHIITTLSLVGSGGGSISSGSDIDVTNYIDTTEIEGLAYDGSNWLFGNIDKEIHIFDDPTNIHLHSLDATNIPVMAYSVSNYATGKAMGCRFAQRGLYPMVGLSDATGTHPGAADCLILGRLSSSFDYLKSRRKESGSSTEVGYPGTTGYAAYDNYEIQWKSEAVKFWNDGTALDASWLSGNVPSGSLYVSLGGNTAGNGTGFNTYADWVYLRKFTENEPTISTWSAEQDGSLLPIDLTGTLSDGATESEIVSGGQVLVLTLDGDTWVATGDDFNAQRQNIIDGLDSAQTETAGWNAEVRDKLDVTQVVRTSNTVVTITF